MASLLQGFEEVQLVKPVGKTVLTVTDSAIRFNKATAEVLGFPAYVKVLINDKTKQIAVTPTTAKADNAIKFSKPEGKQAASVSVKEATLIEAVKAYFTLPEAPEGEIAYQSVFRNFGDDVFVDDAFNFFAVNIVKVSKLVEIQETVLDIRCRKVFKRFHF